MTAGELAERFSHSWSTTTRHLQRLEAAGLVRVTKAGRERRYTLDAPHLLTTTATFLDVFGAGGPARADGESEIGVEDSRRLRHHE
jgi:DNA-binding transcriptional ArsR family regulator